MAEPLDTSYLDGPARLVPGHAGLLRMTELLLAEGAGPEAAILALGAGGGLELRAFALARPGWRLTGVDPDARMLALARHHLGPLAARVRLVEGTAEAAPAGPFDGACCLLVLHFLTETERFDALCHLRARLRRGAALVVAHHSPPEGEAEPWLRRSVAFAERPGQPVDPARAAATMAERLHLLPPAREEALLRDAGFGEVRQFYAAFSFRGWVARAA